MKAARIEAFGGPDKILYGDLPDPEPGKGEVLIRVKACALNHLDLWVRGGLPAYKISLPHVLGNDIVGELIATGPETTAPSTGTRVVVSPGVSCWECAACKSGSDHLCRTYRILGADAGWGGYAELVKVPARNVLSAPSSLTDEQAAALPLTFLTAYHMLKGLAGLQAGQTVLVIGSGSGVGVAAILIAKMLGARVIAASTSENKLDKARELGADEVLLGPSENLARKVRRLSKGGVDVVFEHVGGTIFEQALSCLRPGGAIVTCGATAGADVALDLRRVFFKELRLLGAKMGPFAEFKELVEYVDAGKLTPIVDRSFPLAEARAAHEHLAARKQFGKVILRP
jgi:NADPH:quinone reductase-like Zn-dependent oxidoreductase